MRVRTSNSDRRGVARTRSLVLLVAAALAITGLVATLATVGGEDDDGPSRSVARAEERDGRPAADLVGAPGDEVEVRVAADAPEDSDAPTGDARLSGAIAGPGWSSGAPIEVLLRGVTEDGERVRRELSLDGLGAPWAFDGLPPGAYVARATSSVSPRRAFGASDPVELAAGASEGDVVLRMREYIVEGVVTASDSVPLMRVPVTVDWTLDQWPIIAESRGAHHPVLASSNVRIQRVESLGGQITLELNDLDFGGGELIGSIEVSLPESVMAAEQQRAVAEARQALEAAVGHTQGATPSPSFVVLSSATFANGIGYGPSGPAAEADEAEQHQRLACETDALGRFKLWLPGPGSGGVLAPGADAVEANDRWRWYRQSGSPYAVSVEAPTASIEVEIAHVGEIVGVATAPPRTGDQDLEIFIRPLGRERSSTRNKTARSEDSKDEGRFRFENLPPGRYVIYGRSGGKAGQDVSHRGVVQVHAGAATRVDLALAASSSVVGVLVDAENAPLANARVTAYGEDNDNLSRNGWTDGSGRFTIVGMYGGPYVVRADEHALVEEPRLRVPQGGAVVDAGILRVAAPPQDPGEGASGASKR